MCLLLITVHHLLIGVSKWGVLDTTDGYAHHRRGVRVLHACEASLARIAPTVVYMHVYSSGSNNP
eukprot:COSAG05_NODE_15868_length_359_cov_0.773077_1_plen_64_part_01